jgi:hypothetical protein
MTEAGIKGRFPQDATPVVIAPAFPRALGCCVRRICSPTVIRCNVASVAP